MSSFKTQGKINLEPNDKMNYSFQITVCSSSTSNDGFIPYGRTVSSISVSAENNETGADVTADLINGVPSVSNNIVSMTLNYPTAKGDGRYKLTILLTLDNGNTKEANFNRIYCEDL